LSTGRFGVARTREEGLMFPLILGYSLVGNGRRLLGWRQRGVAISLGDQLLMMLLAAKISPFV